MILLIPNAEEIKKELLNDLNSIMILLILVSIWQKYHICTFKFHYDSINSESCRHCHRWLVNLNSIMILLILYSFLLSRLFLNDLNSIMILLIQRHLYVFQVMLVYLNSIMILLIHIWVLATAVCADKI